MLLVPTLKSLNDSRANQVRQNAMRHLLLEREDRIAEDWGEYAQEMLEEFVQKLPSEPKYWLDRSAAAGIVSRPIATTSIVFNWDRFDKAEKEKLTESVASI